MMGDSCHDPAGQIGRMPSVIVSISVMPTCSHALFCFIENYSGIDMEDETPGVDDDDDDEYNAAALAAAANNDDDAMDEYEKEESQELEATKKERAELLEAELKRKSSSATRVTSSNDKTSGEDDTAAEAVTGSMAYSRTRWDWARRYKRYHYWHTCARHAVSRDRILPSFPKAWSGLGLRNFVNGVHQYVRASGLGRRGGRGRSRIELLGNY